MNIVKMMVIGAGQMGSGVAQVAAEAGVDVILYDLKMGLVEKGINTIKANVSRDIEKGRKTLEEQENLFSRIVPSISLLDGHDVDLVVEAVTENIQVKRDIFRQLDQICPSQTILASNSSSLSITEIASATNRPEQVIGMHFFNPVPVMKLVEVIRGLATSEETYREVEGLSIKLRKIPIEVKDFPGFVSNRILLPMINEAIYCVYEGVAEPQAIDEVMKLGMNHPMGPLTLADFIGLDTCLYIMEILQDELGDSKYRPCPLLRKYVKAGWFGRKTGRGFFEYN
jgi:3-hydroxybutyryl-CoA dehydrogenase